MRIGSPVDGTIAKVNRRVLANPALVKDEPYGRGWLFRIAPDGDDWKTLPSGGWGYLHFPVAVRYARNLGIDCLGMTGKFHTSWGDFHSFKNLAALQYEVFRMLAMGAKCSIGDQLHPTGRIDSHVYDLIGAVYAEVERKQPWCAGARAVDGSGGVLSGQPERAYAAGRQARHGVGALRAGRHRLPGE